MTTPQICAVLILLAMMGLFLWGRIRYDLVGVLALLAALTVGIVKPKEAFSGFSDDIVIIVASALVVSAAVGRSGVMERALRYVAPYARTTRMQVIVLVGTVTALSAVIKNIGALAMLIPVAFQIARKSGKSPSVFLMPMSFGALLGGIVTLIGTSPNIIVSRVRGEILGEPFTMFDFAPVGLGLAAAGVLFLAFGYQLLPKDRRGAATLDEALDIKDYVTEAALPETSPLAGQTVSDLKRLAEGDVTVTAVVRSKTQSLSPLPDATLKAGDILLLEGEPDALERVVARAELQLEAERRSVQVEDPSHEVGVVEAVIGPNSILAGQSARRMAVHERFGLNILAVSRSNKRFTERLRDIKLRAGDVLVLQGDLELVPERMRELGLLPLVERTLQLGSARRAWITMTIVAATVIALAFGLVPVTVAFFGAAALLILFGALPIREAYESIEWPILVMLGTLIPVSDALRTTGTTDLFAGWLSHAASGLPPWGALTLILVAAMAVTPFLNNAATVLVMAPIAAGFATGLGYKPDAFLMAVAVGAACDFLTPIGHQCNTLVMGPGGYRFGDYARLGLPLSIIVIVIGVPLILAVWPLR
ncbi:MAG: family permease [Enterovirga sp.]|jgi:di/tricarboxylate transporter|nr:family permease [Enterovirga sp.]